MADRRGAANLQIPLMLGTLVLLGGFLYYLATTAEPTPPPVLEEEPEEETGPVATALSADSVALNGPALYGQLVRIQDANVGQALGESSFIVNSMQPFVVVMGDDMMAAGEAIPTGTVTLIGTLMQRTDSVLAMWLESGVVTPANEMLADFASEYLVLQGTEAPAGEDESAEGADGTSGDGMEAN